MTTIDQACTVGTCAAHITCKDCVDRKGGPSYARDLLAKLNANRGELATVPSPHRAGGVTTVRTTIPRVRTTIPTVNPPTEKQVKYLRSLLGERQGEDVRAMLNGHREAGTLTRQVVSSAIDDLLARPRTAPTAPAAPAVDDVPAGYYALDTVSDGDNDIAFYCVTKGTGRWAGHTFVETVIGGDRGGPVRGAAGRSVLDRIRKAGVQEATERYGREIGRCGRCHRTLTNKESRDRGIGPECATKL